jgi:probable rRNA maturation factor
MKIPVTNLQSQCRVNRPALKQLAGFFMERAAGMDPDKIWIECSVVVVGHERMIDLNQSVLHHEGTTDVITFAYPTVPGEKPGWRGEIIVNVEEAADVCKRRRSDINRELALYIAHGCQHLGGADDRTVKQRSSMNRRQNRWLREAGRMKLIRQLVQKPG